MLSRVLRFFLLRRWKITQKYRIPKVPWTECASHCEAKGDKTQEDVQDNAKIPGSAY